MNELHLFSGVGGGILAGQLLGHRTVCAVEWEPYAQAVLVARQNDGSLPPFPIWDDVQNFDGKPWRGIVDIVCGGFPCQDISTAGKGAGIDGERSGMWGEMARIIGEVRPRFVFVENSPALTSRGLGRVLGDLAALGFDARWGVLGASDVGAPHKRERIWIVAHANADLQPGSAEPRQQQQRAAQPGGGGRIGLGAGDDVAHAVGQCDRGEIHGGEADRAQAERSASGIGGSGDGSAPDAVADPDSQRTHRSGSWPEQDGGDESTDDGAGKEGLAYSNSLRELQPEGVNTDQWRRPCNGCGYEFYHELLGRYGCPNCEGENIPDCDCDCVQGLEPEPQPGSHGRPAGLHDRARGIHAGAGCATHAPVTRLGRAADGLAQRLDKLAAPWRGDWEGDTPRVASGVAHRSHRLKAIGNGQVSICAATAFNLLKP